MKKYKTWEVIKMFGENPNLQFKNKKGEILEFEIIEFMGNGEKFTLISRDKIISEDEWELIQESVSFNKVLNSSKRCKVEHDILKESSIFRLARLNLKYFIRFEYIHDILENLGILEDNYFMSFGDLITLLTLILSENQLKQIIKEGKWYLEE